jgi:crossover junction endodeoxyribonuclease RuvC
MKIILGIDPGLAATGFGLIEVGNSRYIHLHHGTIKTFPEQTIGERLLTIYEEIGKVIQEFQPTEASVETLYFAKNVKTAIPVAEARGIIMLKLAQHSIPCSGYTPLEVKKAVVGRGRGEKQQVQEMVRVILQLPALPHPDHAADALAVAICHYHYSHMADLIKPQVPDIPGRKARTS